MNFQRKKMFKQIVHREILRRRRQHRLIRLNSQKARQAKQMKKICEEKEAERDDDRKNIYWFSWKIKLITWCLSLSTIFIIFGYILMNSTNFGMRRAKLQIMSSILALFAEAFVVEPVKVAIVTAVVYFSRNKIAHGLIRPEMPLSMFLNPPNRARLMEVRKTRKELAKIYRPQHFARMRLKKAQIRTYIQMDNIIADLVLYLVFVVSLYTLCFVQRNPLAHHNYRMMKDMIGNLNGIITYDKFLNYLDDMLIPAVLQDNYKDYDEPPPDNYTGRRPGKFPPDPPNRPNKSKGERVEKTPNEDRGLLQDGRPSYRNVRLLANLYIRQIRIKPGSCPVHQDVVKIWNITSCNADITADGEDKENYLVGWTKYSDTEPIFDGILKEPWTWRDLEETRSHVLPGKMRGYYTSNGNGYVAELGKTQANAKLTLRFLEYYNWIDQRTRMIYVSFSTYTVSDDIITIVVLIFEVTPTGEFVPDLQIVTTKLFLTRSREMIIYAFFLAVNIITVVFSIIRESTRLSRVGFRAYFTDFWALMSFLFILLGVLNLIIMKLKHDLVREAARNVSEKQNNAYQGYMHLVFMDRLNDYLYALMIFLSTTMILRPLSVNLFIWEWLMVLVDAGASLLGIMVIVTFFGIGTAAYYFLVEGKSEGKVATFYTSFTISMRQLIRRNDVLYDIGEILEYSPVFMPPVFYFVTVYLTLSMVGMFNELMAVHHGQLSKTPMISPYNFIKYFKSRFDGSSDMPLMSKNAVPMREPVRLRKTKQSNSMHPRYIDETRLQGLKRFTLKRLKKIDPIEEAFLNIYYIVKSGNIGRPGTEKYNIMEEENRTTLVSERTVEIMKGVADQIVEERNTDIKIKTGQNLQ